MDFKPSIFSLKNNKFWSAWRIEPTKSHELTALTDCTSWRSFHLKILAKILLVNTSYALDGWIMRAPAFFAVFFYKKNKKAGPREKWCEFYFINFACKKTPTMDRRHSLVPGFHTTCVKWQLQIHVHLHIQIHIH